ncbi:vWA domain-containing protein [Planctomicrobium sp. SH661]|uniref:vWA domain-containing protein n=1 Tax=Planctomicrobium sp. SH661 TaxID=3448124 RepID=UPI003F5C7B23
MSNSPDTSEQAMSIAPTTWMISFSLGGSLILHLSALGLLAALILPAGTPAETFGVRGEFIDTVVNGEAFAGSDTSLFYDLEDPAPAGDSPDLQLTEMADSSADQSSAVQLADLGSSFLISDTGIGSHSMSEKVGGGKSGKVSGKGIGKGSGSGNGDGHGTGGNGTGRGKGGFFGLKVKGKSTVFVVDASRSMNMPHPGPMKTRFNRVKLELVRTISGMTENEKFFIIFFSDGAFPMPANRMMEGEPAVRKRYLSWMSTFVASGQTMPEQALLLALQLEPDQIYFLTDGEFDFSVVPGVTKANYTGVPIHTIGFSDNRGENLLLEIAKRNSGTYTYIPPDDPDEVSDDPGETAASIISGLGK